MTIDSSSTLTEVMQAYDDNASYELNGSLAQAQNFIIACTILLRRVPQATGVQGQQTQLNSQFIHQELQRARRWVATKRSVGSTKYYDLSDIRD